MSSCEVPVSDMSGYDQLGCLHEMFGRQAKESPDKVAVVGHQGQKVTFRQLERMTDALATALRHRGVRRNRIVGIYMERCLEFVVSYIAILKAGGGYLPIEVSYPQPLLESVLEDAEPVVVCTKKHLSERLKGQKEVLILDDDWLSSLEEDNGKLPPFTGPPLVGLDDLAYTVYSSGTTGKPKGIRCPHRGAVFSYHWRHLAFPYEEDDREACNVFFVWEMLRPILKGVPMYIIPDDVIYDPPRLCEFLMQNRITRMLFTPSLLEAVLDTRGSIDMQTSFRSMRQIWFCGEVVTVGLRNRVMREIPHIRLLNLYSISECHDIACSDLTHLEVDQSQKFCPVGRLFPKVHVVIMDSDLNIQPIGLPGEIYVGGPTLALGYLNRPELNAQRFVDAGDCRVYRTGDWGYLRSDGGLEICGRCDSMVKIRGYSIEVQAVEAALLDLPMVNSGCVLALGEEGSDKTLVAYILPEGKTNRREVRAALKRRLPFYMIPAKFIFLDSLPILEASGKLDRKALPKVDLDNMDDIDPEDLPSTPMEKRLAKSWCEVLQLKAVDVQESFFDLGGHSLQAARLLNSINEDTGRGISMGDLFAHPTVSSMASFLEEAGNGGDSDALHPDLLAEVDRHDQGVVKIDMRLRAFWRSVQLASNKWSHGKVLLTGATGFLGSFLLRDLLMMTKTTIYCLVRELPGSSLESRLMATWTEYGILGSADDESEELLKRFQYRVVAIKGDVTLVNLGMTEDDYAYLSYEVDFVIHAAAAVNLVYPYAALHGPNVLGTSNVLVFALNHKIKPIHYIGTDAVFPPGLQDCPEDADMNKYAGLLTDGYSQSKWVAEQLILRARARGLPAAVYRCGNMSAEKDAAHWNSKDFTLLMLQGCVLTGAAPMADWQIEMTPVDFISKILVQMTQNIMQSLGKVFHIVNSTTMDSQIAWQLLKVEGYPVEVIPFNEWRNAVEEATVQQPQKKELANLLRLVDDMVKEESFFSQLSTFQQKNLTAVLEANGETYPPVNVDLLKSYVRKMAKRGLLPRPLRKSMARTSFFPSNPTLIGQVAIVTGASSGIGSAVATHLAAAGVRVALVARREDLLKGLQKSIEESGGVAICVKADVRSRSQMAEAVKHVENLLGPVDILINNAGVMYYTMMANCRQDEWDQQVEVNINGVLNAVGAVLPGMVEREEGHIVNMSSDAGRKAFAGLAVYSGTKHFVEGFSRAMREELVGKGVKVTTIQPGDVATGLHAKSTDQQAKEAYDCSQQYEMLNPEDVARAVLFAVSQPQHCAINEILIEPKLAPI